MDPLGRLFPLVAAFVDHQDAKTVISLQLAVSRVFVTISCWIYCWMVDKPPEKTIILRSVQNFDIHPLMHGSNCIRDFASDVSIRQIYFGTWCYLCYMKEPSMPLWQDAAAELEARASSSSTSSIPISQPSLLPPPLLSSSSISDGPFDSCGVVGSATSPT